MKVEIDSEELTKLRHNADDNRQIVNIVRIIAITIILLIVYFTWITNLCNVLTKKLEADVYTDATISQAYANYRARIIESEGLSHEEYFEWLSVRSD